VTCDRQISRSACSADAFITLIRHPDILSAYLDGPSQNKQSEFCAPLTSFDWNEADPKRLGTSSIDTTVTVWDIERGEVDTQMIAHDKEVYDIAWGGLGVFATVSADGSVRVFDLRCALPQLLSLTLLLICLIRCFSSLLFLRDKEHSTIIFESPTPETPLLRLSWNKQDPRYMATLLMDSPKVIVLDIRCGTGGVGYSSVECVEMHPPRCSWTPPK